LTASKGISVVCTVDGKEDWSKRNMETEDKSRTEQKYGNRRQEQHRTEIWKQKTRTAQNRNMETEDKSNTEQKYGN